MSKTFLPGDDTRLRLYSSGTAPGVERITDLEGFDRDRRTVIILPGTRVTHEIPQPIIGLKFLPSYLTLVKDTLARGGVDPNDVNLVCAVYGHNDEQMISDHYSYPLRKGGHMGASVFTTPASGTDVRAFVRGTLLPLAGIEEGKAVPSVDDAIAALAKVTVVPHSFGTTFAAEADHELRRVLVADYHYSVADAERITSEVVEMALANVSNLTYNGRGFRRVLFSGRADASSLSFMQRIADDHLYDGYVDPQTDPEVLQRDYYRQTGFAHLPEELKDDALTLDAPLAVRGHGQLIRAGMPHHIHWQSNSGKPRFLNQHRLDEEHGELLGAVCRMRNTPDDAGINGQPLIRYGLVPSHDHRMFLQPADENQHIVDGVTTMLTAAVNRAPEPRHSDPATSIAALAATPFGPSPRVSAIDHTALKPRGNERL